MNQSYPEALLPRENYRDRISFESFALENFILVRRSLVSREETINSFGSIRTHAFLIPGKEHLFFNLSLNLLGGCDTKHLGFKTTDSVSGQPWQKGDPIIKLEDIRFEFNADTCPIFLGVSNIHNREFPFNNKKDSKGKLEKYSGKSLVVHSPLQANYWHFEFRVLDKDGIPIPSNEKPWKKEDAIHFVESYLKKFLSIEAKQVPALPDNLFQE